jgi:hypothetical protein
VKKVGFILLLSPITNKDNTSGFIGAQRHRQPLISAFLKCFAPHVNGCLRLKPTRHPDKLAH